MDGETITKVQLIYELAQLRRRVAELEAAEAENKKAIEISGLEGFLEEKLKQYNKALTALNAIAITVSQSLELEQLANTALDKILEITEAVAGRIHLYGSENGQGNGVTDLVIERRIDQNESAIKTNWGQFNIPIKAQDKVLGTLELFNRSPYHWENQDIYLLTAIGYTVGVGIANVRLFAAVKQQSNQLRMLGMRLAEVEEAERRRLARELHDQVGQSLTAMGINLDIIRTLLPNNIPEEIAARLDDTRSLITRTTKRVRQVMVDLRPETLDDYGILAALHWSAEQFTKRTGITVIVEGEEVDSRLPIHIENVLYRVVQEALTNVAKHAQATQVTVGLKVDSEMVLLGRG
jgi:signal transduction histidine kinase